MFTLGTTDFDTLIRDPGIVKSKFCLAFFALDYHLRLLDDDSSVLISRQFTELSETTLVLYQKGCGVSNHYAEIFRLFSQVLRADSDNRTRRAATRVLAVAAVTDAEMGKRKIIFHRIGRVERAQR